MRASLATITVCLLSGVTLLAAEPRRLSDSLLLVRSLNFGEELWPDEPSHGENQLVPPKTVYGPSDDEPRKTLFQWSYGTSFGGAPDLDEPLITDRPDFTEASSTVGKGVLQIESGYTYVRNKDPDDNSMLHSAGEVLFRYGVLANWLEFRLQALPLFQTSSTGEGRPRRTAVSRTCIWEPRSA